eukprot:279298_1
MTTPQKLYDQYVQHHGYTPQKADHLIAYAKQSADVKLKFSDAQQIIKTNINSNQPSKHTSTNTNTTPKVKVKKMSQTQKQSQDIGMLQQYTLFHQYQSNENKLKSWTKTSVSVNKPDSYEHYQEYMSWRNQQKPKTPNHDKQMSYKQFTKAHTTYTNNTIHNKNPIDANMDSKQEAVVKNMITNDEKQQSETKMLFETTKLSEFYKNLGMLEQYALFTLYKSHLNEEESECNSTINNHTTGESLEIAVHDPQKNDKNKDYLEYISWRNEHNPETPNYNKQMMYEEFTKIRITYNSNISSNESIKKYSTKTNTNAIAKQSREIEQFHNYHSSQQYQSETEILFETTKLSEFSSSNQSIKKYSKKTNTNANKLKSLMKTSVSVNIDFSIYETTIIICSKDKYGKLIQKCTCLKRAVLAMRYYEMLCDNGEAGKLIFIPFCLEIYKHFLDDYIHIVNNHMTATDLTLVAEELVIDHGFFKCDVKTCQKVSRHYRRTRNTNNENEDDVKREPHKYAFLADCFDQLHHFFFHLFDIGMKIHDINVKNDIINENDDFDSLYIDNALQERRQLILLRRKQCGLDLYRYTAGNNKYNLNVSNKEENIVAKKDKSEKTFTDRLLSELKHGTRVSFELQTYLATDEYDSDAITDDFDQYESDKCSSNIYNFLSKYNFMKRNVESIGTFVRYRSLSAFSFSTGFLFFYDTKYKYDFTCRTGDLFNGYSPDALYVAPYYTSMREEALESSFLQKHQWVEKVHEKATNYMDTAKVKGLASVSCRKNVVEIDTVKQVVEIYNVSIAHLHAIILYCDWTDLCTHFSATYRRKNQFEKIKAVTCRHSKYHYLGKLLAQLVHRFGSNGEGSIDTRFEFFRTTSASEKGPFYCGLSVMLHMGSFAMYLKGPCSTTKDIEVSMNFAKREGIIMQLQNDILSEGKRCRFWNCAWTSTYAEENERLFISEKYRMRIQSIRIINTNQNFELFFHSFHLFDSIISGVKLNYHLNVLKTDFKILNKMISNKLGKTNHKFDPYIQNVFSLFLSTKKRIRINMLELHKYGKKISNLIMHSVEENDYGNIDPNSYCNVIRSDIISIFPYIEEIVIYTSGCEVASVHFKAYRFSIKSFVSCIELINRPKLICRIFAEKDQYGYSWLYWLAIKDSNTWRISLTLDFMENDQHVLMVKHKI